jgi:hypothetical protein
LFATNQFKISCRWARKLRATVLLGSKGLTLEVEKSNGVVVHGDGGRLRQVIGNLLDNAIKYTPAPGHVTISVGQNNRSARIRVADTGSGFLRRTCPGCSIYSIGPTRRDLRRGQHRVRVSAFPFAGPSLRHTVVGLKSTVCRAVAPLCPCMCP